MPRGSIISVSVIYFNTYQNLTYLFKILSWHFSGTSRVQNIVESYTSKFGPRDKSRDESSRCGHISWNRLYLVIYCPCECRRFPLFHAVSGDGEPYGKNSSYLTRSYTGMLVPSNKISSIQSPDLQRYLLRHMELRIHKRKGTYINQFLRLHCLQQDIHILSTQCRW